MALKKRPELMGEVYRRLGRLESSAEIVRDLHQQTGLSTRQLRRYVQEARKQMAEEAANVDRPRAIAEMMGALREIARLAIEERHLKTALTSLSLMATYQGIAPEAGAIDVRLTGLGVDLEEGEQTSIDAMRKRLRELLARGGKNEPDVN